MHLSVCFPLMISTFIDALLLIFAIYEERDCTYFYIHQMALPTCSRSDKNKGERFTKT